MAIFPQYMETEMQKMMARQAPGLWQVVDPGIQAKTVMSLLEESAALRVLADEYDIYQIDHPEWLTEKLKKLAREIKAAHRREQEERLARLEAEVRELRSKEEKRVAAEEEIARLRKALEV